MKMVECNGGETCRSRRVHWDEPNTPRGPQFVPMPDGHEGPVYCSITCAVMDGAMRLCCKGRRDDPHEPHCRHYEESLWNAG
jgi:hypothetical protein